MCINYIQVHTNLEPKIMIMFTFQVIKMQCHFTFDVFVLFWGSQNDAWLLVI